MSVIGSIFIKPLNSLENLVYPYEKGVFMKFLSALVSLFFVLSNLNAQTTSNISNSALDQTIAVTGFGDIRYRKPLAGSTGYPVLLVHGVYGGASHRSFRELLPKLDAAGKAVYIVDLPGVGESAKPKRSYEMADFDLFLTTFLSEVIKQRTTVVAESILSVSALKVAGDRPDLIRRLVLLSPTGVSSLNTLPSEREQNLYDRLYNDEIASEVFYKNLLQDNSLNYFLKFAFYNDDLVNESLLNDYRAMRDNVEQKYLTISFVGGQLHRTFESAAQNVFIPVLNIFGKNYEVFAEGKLSTAEMFKAIRPDFDYLEIEDCGSSVQREQPDAVARAIIDFSIED